MLPTAQTLLLAMVVTALKSVPLKPPTGLGTTLQEVPFQCRASVWWGEEL
jgi:hypothetical protein